MPKAHLANTDFEFELFRDKTLSLQESLESHPILLQLQFLPYLFADATDTVITTQAPNSSYIDQLMSLGWWKAKEELPKGGTLSEKQADSRGELEVWGASLAVADWAEKNRLAYKTPDLPTVRKVHSKVYSFSHTPKLPSSKLISNKSELEEWLSDYKGPKVLKSAFGVAARGHLILPEHDGPSSRKILGFCEQQWKHKQEVIGEPWVERVLDFSTQWEITATQQIHFIGAAQLENDQHGCYLRTHVGSNTPLFQSYANALEQHKTAAHQLLQRIADEGYYGPIGVDAMLYKDPTTGQESLRPVVEVNTRQTMSLVAIKIQKKWHPNQTLALSYKTAGGSSQGLLPTTCKHSSGKIIEFKRQLYLQLI